MVEVKVYSGGSVATRAVDESLFGDRILKRTLKDAVVMYEANTRSGTAKAKTRGEVRGPNNKLWKQKHTGRARMGTKKSPLWRGGGAVFGPRPRDYFYQMPRKARRVALRTALLSKFRDGEVVVAEGWPTQQPSTKAAMAILGALGLAAGGVLVVTEEHDTVLYRSLRNVPRVDVRPLSDLNAFEVLVRRHMVMTPGALTKLEEQMAAAPAKRHGAQGGPKSAEAES